MPPLARLISLGILTVLIVALGITFYQVLAPFLLPLFLAWVTAILCRPLYLWCVAKTNGRERLAAGLTTAGLLIVVLLPLVLGTVFASAQLIEVATKTIGNPAWRDKISARLEGPWIGKLAQTPWIEAYLNDVKVPGIQAAGAGDATLDYTPPDEGADPFAEEADSVEETEEERIAREARELEIKTELLKDRLVQSVRATLQYVGGRTIGIVGEIPGVALGVLGKVVSLLVALVMFAIGLYYFLCDGPALVEAAESLIPVRVDYQRELLHRFDQVVRAVVLSTFLSALAQGVLTAVALGFAGFEHLLVFFVLASLAAMIPLAGTWLVWGPCAIWLVIQGQSAASADQMAEAYRNWTAAGLLTVFGIVVIGLVDNVIRTYILNSNAKLHPLLAFVSVLGGLQVMGLWGVFIAPVVAACLHALMQIFNAELKAFSLERTAGREASLDEAVSPPVLPTPADPTTPSRPSAAAKPATVVVRPVPAGAGKTKRRRR